MRRLDNSKAFRYLQPILDFVEEFEDEKFFNMISIELQEDGLEKFLASNSLWGGAGSIADQAGVGLTRENRRIIESFLISLGKYQISVGILNPRTKSWIEAFKLWKKKGI